MSNAAILIDNVADRAVVTASTQQQLTPISNLQNEHVIRKWRGAGGAADYIVADLGSIQPIGIVALLGLSLTQAGRTRLRLSTADGSGEAGDAYDSGVVTGLVDPTYGALIALTTPGVSARFVRIDLVQPGAAYVEAGRLVIGTLQQFEINFAYGWQRQWVDQSQKSKSASGQTFIGRKPSYRSLKLSFENLSQAERDGLIETLDAVNGEHVDVLMIPDPASRRLDRDSIFGLVTASPVGQPYFQRFSKEFNVEERL